MKNWREDNTALRNFMKTKKGFTEADLNGIHSEKIVDGFQAEYEKHLKGKQTEKVQALVNDKKRSPVKRIADLLTIDDD